MFKLLLATALTGITTLTAAPQAKPATNTICPVAGDKVTAKSKTVAVRGQEYRICCAGCDKKLLVEPDKYLNKDGTPKNVPKAAK